MGDDTIDQLGTLAHDTAGQLRLLADTMTGLGWQPDGYTPDGLREMAAALHGMAMRTAMHTGNTARLTELTGRPVRELPTGVL